MHLLRIEFKLIASVDGPEINFYPVKKKCQDVREAKTLPTLWTTRQNTPVVGRTAKFIFDP